jgi:glyoxylase-like metal-dependent hydrolase (beta-lactamase superfamily II)
MKTWVTKNGHKIRQIMSGRSNVFLLTNGNRNILLDTGSEMMWHGLDKRLKRLNISRIDLLVLTHSHYDHSGNARLIREIYKPLVIIHKNEASYLTTGEIVVPGGTNFYARILTKLFPGRLAPFFKPKPCPFDLIVDSYFDLREFGFNAYILHTPGHTPGSLSLIAEDEVALVGDTMFGVCKWSVFPPFAVDTGQMFKSWKRLLDTNCSVFIPSHGTANPRSLVLKTYCRKVKNRV